MAAVTKLLPVAVDDVRRSGERRPWIIRYGSRQAVLRATDLAAIRNLGFTPELAQASLSWLHALLRDVNAAGFTAPTPLDELHGRSIAVIDGIAWELLSFIPGRPMGWSDAEMRSAGGLLAALHNIVEKLPARPQRPGALPVGECSPVAPAARQIRGEVERELARLKYDSLPRSVVHGDATQANVVIDADRFALVDYTIAYQEPLLFDIASALWRNGRTEANAVSYEPRRAALFVLGYREARRLRPDDAEAIVLFMKGRGLQLQQRLERRKGQDETVLARLQAICVQAQDLEAAIRAAIADD